MNFCPSKKILPFLSSEKVSSWLVAFIIVWYVSLCVVNYFAQRPLWNDEYWVFQSVKDFSPREMFSRTLVQDQTFPRVPLFLIQQISKPFDFHLLALRFLSFVSMLAGSFLWVKIARQQMKEKKEYLTFLLSWCASVPLVYYSAELKQYSMDVFVAAVFVYFLYNQERMEAKLSPLKYTALLMALPTLVLFSYPAYFFVLFPLYHLLRRAGQGKKVYRNIFAYGLSLVIFVLLSYFFDIRLRPYETNTGSYADHFVYFNSSREFFRTFGDGVVNLFSRWFAEDPKSIRKIGWVFVGWGLIYMFYGFFKNLKKEKYFLRSIATIALILFAEFFVLGALKKYPFSVPRTSLFFAPVVLFLTVKGITATERIHILFSRTLHAAYVLFLLVVAVALSRVFFCGNPSFAPVLW